MTLLLRSTEIQPLFVRFVEGGFKLHLLPPPLVKQLPMGASGNASIAKVMFCQRYHQGHVLINLLLLLSLDNGGDIGGGRSAELLDHSLYNVLWLAMGTSVLLAMGTTILLTRGTTLFGNMYSNLVGNGDLVGWQWRFQFGLAVSIVPTAQMWHQVHVHG